MRYEENIIYIWSNYREKNYKAIFDIAEQTLKTDYDIVNPANFHKLESWEQYMDFDISVLKQCDVIYMLSNHINSIGAKIELLYAEKWGLEIRFEKNITIESILDEVIRKENISLQSLKSKSRKREIVMARQLYSYLAKANTSLSLAKIGSYINKDHSTILYNIKVVKYVRELQDKLKNYD